MLMRGVVAMLVLGAHGPATEGRTRVLAYISAEHTAEHTLVVGGGD